MQKHVGEDWGDRAALRRALDPLDQCPVGPLHRGLQPALHVHRDPFLVAVARDRPQHQLPRDGIKEGPDVEIDNPVLLQTPLPANRDRVHRRASGTVSVRILVEDRLHTGLQRHRRRRLRDPVRDIRNAEHPDPTLLGYLHRPNRPREIRPRRHPIPQPIEVPREVLLEPFDRDAVSPGRSAIVLDLQPRIPHQSLGDVMRLALQLRLMHALPPIRLSASIHLDDPAPWLHPRCDTRKLHSYYGRVRQRARRRYSAPRGFCRLEPSLSPREPPRQCPGSPSHVPATRCRTHMSDHVDRRFG
jgi:hypothetical protein